MEKGSMWTEIVTYQVYDRYISNLNIQRHFHRCRWKFMLDIYLIYDLCRHKPCSYHAYTWYEHGIHLSWMSYVGYMSVIYLVYLVYDNFCSHGTFLHVIYQVYYRYMPRILPGIWCCGAWHCPIRTDPPAVRSPGRVTTVIFLPHPHGIPCSCSYDHSRHVWRSKRPGDRSFRTMCTVHA